MGVLASFSSWKSTQGVLLLLCIVRLMSVCYGDSCSPLPRLLGNETALVVDLVGNFYLVATRVGELKWSFSSGYLIYSSYRGCLPDEEYIDCDVDWNLYFFRNDTKIRVADLNGDRIRKPTRYVFIIDYVFDAISGRVIDMYPSPPGKMKVFERESIKQRLYITMKYVAYKNYSTGSVGWNLSYSEFQAYMEYEGFREELPVHRVRDLNFLESPIPIFPVCPPIHRSVVTSKIEHHNWIVPSAVDVLSYIVTLAFGFFVQTCLFNPWKDLGHKKGVIEIYDEVIGHGSNGTVVCKGLHQGRLVAVKKVSMVKTNKQAANKERDILLKVEEHCNVVKFYAYEADGVFEYLALELCHCILEQLVKTDFEFEDVELWRVDKSPTSQLVALMSDVFCGIRHLHENEVLHRDLKPSNVLVKTLKFKPFIRALVSDVGSSRSIPSGSVSPDSGSGKSCWQAPEQLLRQSQTRATDWFSFGCILYYAVSGGGHPFVDESVAEDNIKIGNFDLSKIKSFYEAADLVNRLLSHSSFLRPNADQILSHPFFWSGNTRMLFLKDASDRLQASDNLVKSDFDLEGNQVFNGDWSTYLVDDHKLMLLKHKHYIYTSFLSLLRSIRNTHNHFDKVPPNVQQIMRDKYDGLLEYYTARFKNLFIVVYKFVEARYRFDQSFIHCFP